MGSSLILTSIVHMSIIIMIKDQQPEVIRHLLVCYDYQNHPILGCRLVSLKPLITYRSENEQCHVSR